MYTLLMHYYLIYLYKKHVSNKWFFNYLILWQVDGGCGFNWQVFLKKHPVTTLNLTLRILSFKTCARCYKCIIPLLWESALRPVSPQLSLLWLLMMTTETVLVIVTVDDDHYQHNREKIDKMTCLTKFFFHSYILTKMIYF